MKSILMVAIFAIVSLLLISCGQPQLTPLSTTTPTVWQTSTPYQTVTANAQSTHTPTLLSFTPTFEPTLLPTIEPTKIPGLLRNSFSIETSGSLDGHNLTRISGWSYGFRPSRFCQGPYLWMDNDHLMLLPLVGQEYSMGIEQLTLPVVINRQSGDVWLPPTDDPVVWGCNLPEWSEALHILVTTEQGEVLTFGFDGEPLERYPGYQASLSPSGTKLMAGSMWVDLLTGSTVDFASQEINGLSTWASDEMQLYSCCYDYANARTGKAFTFDLGGLRYVGRDYGAGFTGIRNMWVMNDTYVITYWDFQNNTEQNVFPLIEPATQTYKDLRYVTDIPDDLNCRPGAVAPDRKHIWVNCYKPNNYLVNLETLTANAYPEDLSIAQWSSKSDFAWLQALTSDDPPEILSLSSKKLQRLPMEDVRVETIVWHPNESVLAFLTEEMQTLALLDAPSMVVEEFPLPSTFRGLIWKPDGQSIALIAEDGSLWQADYPRLENIQQLTPAFPGVREVLWSPDGTFLAFISGADLYIVEAAE